MRQASKHCRSCHACLQAVERRLLLAAHVAGSPAVYATIQSAVNAAPSGGTVTVDAGTYAEQVTINKPLNVQGAQAGTDARSSGRPNASATTESVVTGASSGGQNAAAFHVLANDVTIDGFTVTGQTNPDDQLGAGIVIGPGQSGTHIINDVIRNNVAGLFLANASSTDTALIQHCDFNGNNNNGDNGGRGIYTDGTISGGHLTNVTIDANTFANNHGGAGTTHYEAAIAFEAGNPGQQSAIRITNNTLTTNGKAVLFFNATDVLIQGNTVTNTWDQWSGSLRFEGNVNHVSILDNTVYRNAGPAVAVDSKGTPGDNYGFVVNGNNFYSNNHAYSVPISVVADFSTYDGAFDARNNYWGSPSGPSGYGPGTGDAVGGGTRDPSKGWSITSGADVLFSPWATVTISPPGTPAPTPTSPAAPAGLTATAASSSQITMAWTEATAAATFIVQRSADGSAFAQIGTAAAGVTTYADAAHLTPGTTYSYRVLAVSASGTSGPSNVATATTQPAAPQSSAVVAWTGTIIGTPGSYNNAGNTIAHAVDGNLNTFYDAATASGNWVGFDLGAAEPVTQIGYAPRSGYAGRMVGGIFQASPTADFSTGVVNLFTVAAPPPSGTLTTVTLGTTTTARYYRYLSPANSNGNIAEVQFDGPSTATQRTGTVIGTPGSYNNAGNTIANAFDGKLNTFYDAAVGSGNWVGLDLGTAQSISQISYAPRAGYAARMVGGVFQASATADFSSGVTTLDTVTAAPMPGLLTTVPLSSPITARFVRYLSPANSYGNVAEFAFAG